MGLYRVCRELQPGSEILATPLREGAPSLAIRISSNEIVCGGSAFTFILQGEAVSSEPAEDRVTMALKVVMEDPDSNNYHERIRREIAAVQHVQHRFILPFLGVATGSTYTILVSHFMENGHLLSYLKTNPGASRRQLILQVAEAVDYLHTQAGLVHGDLKCQNVLVSPHGVAQLADFGLSTIVEKPSAAVATDYEIRRLCTLQFAAPELLTDDAKSPSGKTRSKTPQTDVFAFGRLVLQAFTGTLPWPEGEPYLVVFYKILQNKTPARPEGAAALGLNDIWWSMCEACWLSEPGERPSMRDII